MRDRSADRRFGWLAILKRNRRAGIGVLAVLGLAPFLLASDAAVCGNHQGEPALLGCSNDSTDVTALISSAGFGALEVHSTSYSGTGVFASANGTAIQGNGLDTGVSGRSDHLGVTGFTDEGTGVLGHTFDGIGVHAEAESAEGLALKVDGPAAFSRSGAVTFPAGRYFVAVTGQFLTSSSLVLATVQGEGLPGVFIQGVRTIPTQNKFNIYLNKVIPVGSSLRVAWFVMN